MTRPKRRKELPALTEGDLRFGTPEIVAAYRAERLCGGVNTVIEAGAGAGFQTRSFAGCVELVVAIDPDAQRLSRANFPENVRVITGDSLDPNIVEDARKAAKGRAIVFLDPERPAGAKERTLGQIRPDPESFVRTWWALTPDIAIELPPFLREIPWQCEREYLSVDGELNRLTVYLGGLRKCDVSVVSLPGGERVEHSGPLPVLGEARVEGRFVLEPDRALEHAGLAPLALPPARRLPLGKRQAYLSDELPGNGLFKAYRVVAKGSRDELPAILSREGCRALILHGSLAPEEQAELLESLKPSCTGGRRLHAFLGEQVFVAERV